jgi:RNA polymerase sigma-70 factor (ECF subfamily)
MTDEALLGVYRKTNDMPIIGELFDRYAHLVLGVCIKYLKNEEEAKDACMQVFEKLISDLKSTHITQFKGWLHTVSRNHCLIIIRKKVSSQAHFDEFTKNFSQEFVNFWSELNHIHETETELNNLTRAMEELDLEQRQCIELIYFQDKSYKQITEITGFELNKVKSCIQNGKRNLKLLLEKEYGKARE